MFSAVQLVVASVDRDQDVKIDKCQDGNRKVMGTASQSSQFMAYWGLDQKRWNCRIGERRSQ